MTTKNDALTQARETPPGMAVQALADEIVEALLADEKDGGYDLTAGLFGAAFSKLVRRWAAAEWNTHPTQQPEAQTETMLRDLLAVIHGDGGHYTERYGLEQSVKDSFGLVAELRAAMEKQQPAPQPVDERERFEAWLRGSVGPNAWRSEIEAMWEGWRARSMLPANQVADDQEAFKAWCSAKGLDVSHASSLHSNRTFEHIHVDGLWEAWQARSALSAAPQAREWRELTPEEMQQAIRPLCQDDDIAAACVELSSDEYRAISAALKAKNHGGGV